MIEYTVIDSITCHFVKVVAVDPDDDAVDWGSGNKDECHMVVHHSSLLLACWLELSIRVMDELRKVLGAWGSPHRNNL